jgi:hypothetical protein
MKFLSCKYFEEHKNFRKSQDISEGYFSRTPTGKVLIISHIWVTQNEPDPLSTQFEEVKYLVLRDKWDYVFYDYSSLPQKPRSKQEESEFIEGLSKMKSLYTNTLFPEAQCKVAGLFKHDLIYLRGWPYFEASQSIDAGCSLIKNLPNCMKLKKGLERVLIGEIPEKNEWDMIMSSELISDLCQSAICTILKKHYDENPKIKYELFNDVTKMYKVGFNIKYIKYLYPCLNNPENDFEDELGMELHQSKEVVNIINDASDIIRDRKSIWVRDQMINDLTFCQFTNGSDKDELIRQSLK